MKAETTYFKKTCPVCDHTFHMEDDIIVCPECERPHHVKCWHKNKGCGLIDCLGGKVHDKFQPRKKEDELEEVDEELKETFTMNCPVCEACIETDSVRCPYCESRLKRKFLTAFLKLILLLAAIGGIITAGWFIFEWVTLPRLSRDRPATTDTHVPAAEYLTIRQEVEKLWREGQYDRIRSLLEKDALLDSDPEYFYPFYIGVLLYNDEMSVLTDNIHTIQETLSPEHGFFYSGFIYAAAENNRRAGQSFREYNYSFYPAQDNLPEIIRFLPQDLEFEYSQRQLYLQSTDETLFLSLKENFENWDWNQEEGFIYGNILSRR